MEVALNDNNNIHNITVHKVRIKKNKYDRFISFEIHDQNVLYEIIKDFDKKKKRYEIDSDYRYDENMNEQCIYLIDLYI